MKKNEMIMVLGCINDLEKRYGYDEMELRKEIRRCLPSWKITRDSQYGPMSHTGWRRGSFQIYKKEAEMESRLEVLFYEYEEQPTYVGHCSKNGKLISKLFLEYVNSWEEVVEDMYKYYDAISHHNNTFILKDGTRVFFTC